MPPEDIMRAFKAGDEHSWWVESMFLWRFQAEGMNSLADDMANCGMRNPVLIGNDGRVWDGHHRIVIAAGLGIPKIPVRFAGKADTTADLELKALELVADAAKDYLTSDHYTDRATLIGALQDYDRLKRLGAD